MVGLAFVSDRWFGVRPSMDRVSVRLRSMERSSRRGDKHEQRVTLCSCASLGRRKRAFTHVADTVDGIVLVGEKGEGIILVLGRMRFFHSWTLHRCLTNNRDVCNKDHSCICECRFHKNPRPWVGTKKHLPEYIVRNN